MVADLQALRDLLGRLDPDADGFELQADELVVALKPELGASVCQLFLEFFDAHPLSYMGVPGTFVHHIETFYPSYIPALVLSVARRPSLNGILLMSRILNSPDCGKQTRNEFLGLLQNISTSETCEEELVGLASRYLSRHT